MSNPPVDLEEIALSAYHIAMNQWHIAITMRDSRECYRAHSVVNDAERDLSVVRSLAKELEEPRTLHTVRCPCGGVLVVEVGKAGGTGSDEA